MENSMPYKNTLQIGPLDLSTTNTGCNHTPLDFSQNEKPAKARHKVLPPVITAKPGGWVLVGRTVVPYVWRDGNQHLPVSVLRYGAGLLNSTPTTSVCATASESSSLNQLCMQGGICFTFKEDTKLISLRHLMAMNALTASMLTVICSDGYSLSDHLRKACLPGKMPTATSHDRNSSLHSLISSWYMPPQVKGIKSDKLVHRRKRHSQPKRLTSQ